MSIQDEQELVYLKAVGRIVRQVLDAMKAEVQPGVTTQYLDEIGARVMEENGARSAPRMGYQFPGASCISLNDEAVHGISRRSQIERRRSGETGCHRGKRWLYGRRCDYGASGPSERTGREIDDLRGAGLSQGHASSPCWIPRVRDWQDRGTRGAKVGLFGDSRIGRTWHRTDHS